MLVSIRANVKQFKDLRDFSELDLIYDNNEGLHLPLSIQGTPYRQRFVWQTSQDHSWSNLEPYHHQDNTDPSLLGIFSDNQVGRRMACIP